MDAKLDLQDHRANPDQTVTTERTDGQERTERRAKMENRIRHQAHASAHAPPAHPDHKAHRENQVLRATPAMVERTANRACRDRKVRQESRVLRALLELLDKRVHLANQASSLLATLLLAQLADLATTDLRAQRAAPA